MTSLSRRLLTAAIACSVVAIARPTFAQHSDDAAVAEALFKEAKRLMRAGDYATACPKLEASQELDSALGTLMNLADCYEKQGKTASAWAKWQASLDIARKRGERRKTKVAAKRVAKLEPQLSYLTILAPEAASTPGLMITRDGAVMGRARLGTPLPIDPGKYLIAASAPEREPWAESVEIGGGGAALVVTVPALAVMAPPPPTSQPLVLATPTSMPTSAPTVVAATTQPTSAPVVLAPWSEGPETPTPVAVATPIAAPVATVIKPTPAQPRAAKGVRVRAVITSIALTLGVAGFGTSGYYAWTALEKWSDARQDNDCDDQGGCNVAGARLARDAQKAASFATIAAVAGGTAMFLGIVISATSPAEPPVAEPKPPEPPIAEPAPPSSSPSNQ